MSDELQNLLRGALRSRLVKLGFGLFVAALVQLAMARYGAALSPDLQATILGFAGLLVAALRADTHQSLAEKGRTPPTEAG